MPSSGRSGTLQKQHTGVFHDPLRRGPPWSVHWLGPHFLWLQRKSRIIDDLEHHLHVPKAQGAFKYGGYEFFKKFYSDLVGQEKATKWKTSIYLTASASAEFVADVALCPFEAIKVRMQTTIPPEVKGTFSGISSVVSKEGVAG